MNGIPTIDESDYKIIKTLGKGAFGEVKLAEDKKGERVAIKYIFKEMDDEQLGKLQEEVDILKKLSTAPKCRPGIVCYHGLFKLGGKVVLIMDYVEGTDLGEWMKIQREENIVLTPEEFLKFAIPLTETVAYMHSLGITHRDIKPENIIFTEDRLVLVDFGIACYDVYDKGEPMCDRWVGTSIYAPPESNFTEYYPFPRDGKHDVWSLGCLFYDMVTLTYTTYRKLKNFSYLGLRNYPMPRCINPTPEIGKLITMCFESEPEERITSTSLWQKLVLVKSLGKVDGYTPENVLTNAENDVSGNGWKCSAYIKKLESLKFLYIPGVPEKIEISTESFDKVAMGLRYSDLVVVHDFKTGETTGDASETMNENSLIFKKKLFEPNVFYKLTPKPDPNSYFLFVASSEDSLKIVSPPLK